MRGVQPGRLDGLSLSLSVARGSTKNQKLARAVTFFHPNDSSSGG